LIISAQRSSNRFGLGLAWISDCNSFRSFTTSATISDLTGGPRASSTDCLPRCSVRDGTSQQVSLDMAQQRRVDEQHRPPQPHNQGTSLTALGLAPSITDLELVARILCVCETRLTRRSLSTRRRKFTGRQSCNLSVGTHIQQDWPTAASIHVEVGTHPSPLSACILPSCVHVSSEQVMTRDGPIVAARMYMQACVDRQRAQDRPRRLTGKYTLGLLL